MDMRAGKLRHRVEIQSATNTRAADGGVVQSWATLDERWANVEALSGRELERARQINPVVTHKITMRYFGLSEGMRLKHGPQVFGIESVIDPEGRKIVLEVMCKRLAADAVPVLNETGQTVYNETGRQVFAERL